MEHRLARRLTVDATVLVYCRGHSPVVGKVSNINEEGMFIRSSGGELAKGTGVEVEILGPGYGEYGMRLLGVVVHGSKRGVGVLLAPVPGGLMRQMKKARQLEKRQA